MLTVEFTPVLKPFNKQPLTLNNVVSTCLPLSYISTWTMWHHNACVIIWCHR